MSHLSLRFEGMEYHFQFHSSSNNKPHITLTMKQNQKILVLTGFLVIQFLNLFFNFLFFIFFWDNKVDDMPCDTKANGSLTSFGKLINI